MSSVLYNHLKEQSEALKEANSNVSICHVHDRGCDSAEYLEFIKDTLNDDAVVMAKKSRNSQQTRINPQTGKRIKIKLIESTFKYKKVYLIKQLTLNAKHYSQVKCHIST